MSDVVDAAEARVAEAPDQLLYSFLDSRGVAIEQLTRAGFWARTQAIATALVREQGLKPGDRVILAYPPGLEMISAFFGAAYAGLIPVPTAAPTSHGLHAALYKLAHIGRDSGAACVLSHSSVLDLVSRARDIDDASAAATAMRWVATDTLPAASADPNVRARSPLLFLQYTSGSTSAPKGVMVTHDNILANARQVVDHANPVGVSWLPQHHDMGLIGYYINGAILGGTLYGFSPTSFIQRPALWLESITKYRATVTSAPNFAFEYCLRPGRISAARREALDLSSLEFLMAAAEPIKVHVYEAFLQTFMPYGLRRSALVVAYGLAENTLSVSSNGRRSLAVIRSDLAKGMARPTEKVSEVRGSVRLMSCGQPLGNTKVSIVDPAARQLLPDGRVGEIWVAGDSKCAGYWNNPKATREAFQAHLVDLIERAKAPRWLRTGDLGFKSEGELFVCGRMKDVIIVRGQNHYPQDIEAVVEQSCDAVRDGGVAAFESANTDRVAVVAEVSGAATPDGDAVLSEVRKRLGVAIDDLYFVPARSVPKTSSGKVMRFKAREMLSEGRFTILQHIASGADDSADDQISGSDELPFASFRSRYRLTGTEDITLHEAGLDSLDLVLFVHELEELLQARGLSDLAVEMDFKLVQHLSVAEIFRLVARIDHDPGTAAAQVRRLLRNAREQSIAAERRQMTADRALPFEPSRAAPLAEHPMRSALITGATGFLGPFLLSNLLRQTHTEVHALVRAKCPEEGKARLRVSLRDIGAPPDVLAAFEQRVTAVPGDLEAPNVGLSSEQRHHFATNLDAIFHNGALVNYLFTYDRMRAANVVGTTELLKLAFEGRPKVFNHVSTTFIFGWATKDVLSEDDDNADMELLDFGYSQSKWVSEQLVLDARRRGLATRIFRPALITPSLTGAGGGLDITLRILAFMVRHGITVGALNQVSFVPADIAAQNIVALSVAPSTLGNTFHITRDDYANMGDVMAIISRRTGRRFEVFDLADFVPEVIRRCTLDDPLFPLLDFLVGSIDNISSMEFKRYDNRGYQSARAAVPGAAPDPSLELTVAGVLEFLRTNGMAELTSAPAADARQLNIAD